MPDVAKTVVYRHPCDCATASRPLERGEEPEHRFDVDGQPFPWHITEDGASFARSASGIYWVSVSVLPYRRDTGEPVEFRCHPDRLPVLGDAPFPWYITGPVVYSVERGSAPTLELTFVAYAVDVDCEISAAT